MGLSAHCRQMGSYGYQPSVDRIDAETERLQGKDSKQRLCARLAKDTEGGLVTTVNPYANPGDVILDLTAIGQNELSPLLSSNPKTIQDVAGYPRVGGARVYQSIEGFKSAPSKVADFYPTRNGSHN